MCQRLTDGRDFHHQEERVAVTTLTSRSAADVVSIRQPLTPVVRHTASAGRMRRATRT